ncbi:MAG: ribosome maturation factor RimM [Methylococcaceae bacterium]|nr:ribosome maturation factor RimM [Methylococcaceae bacterium]
MARRVVVGEVAGAFGVRGWLKIYSHTEPPENILGYSPWFLEGKNGVKEYKIVSGRLHGKMVLVQLEGVDERDLAISLKSHKVMVGRECFPPVQPGRYYWADLVGLKVKTCEDIELGTVSEMMATGANDVMVVQGERERLIPFVLGQYVKQIDLEQGLAVVDWDPEF